MSALTETALYPVIPARAIKRVAILFAGGPAPAANAVISTAAASFRRNGIEVIGIMHGYAHLIDYRDDNPMKEGRDYIVLDQSNLRRTRNTRGILIGTSRTNPGKDVSQPAHLADPERTAQLRTVHRALASLGVNALVSIGGDDTLKTANKFKRFQDYLPAERAADRGGARPQDDRQRLPRHRLHVRLFHGRRDPGRRDPQPPGRRRGGPDVLPGRDHGPQRRLAGLRRGDRRRGQPGPLRRRPHRRPHDRGNTSPTPRPARRVRVES